MRRALVVLSVVMLIVLLLAMPSLVAARGGHGGGQGGASFNVQGTIAWLNSGAMTMGVDVVSPEGMAGEINVYVTGDTHLKECGGASIDFGDLAEGDEVRVSGTEDGGAYVATRVIRY